MVHLAECAHDGQRIYSGPMKSGKYHNFLINNAILRYKSCNFCGQLASDNFKIISQIIRE